MADIASTRVKIAAFDAEVAALAVTPAKPTITNMTATPNQLPVGGGSVVINATVVGATSLKLDGVNVVLPVTIVV